MRISDWSSDVCSSDLLADIVVGTPGERLVELARQSGEAVDIGGNGHRIEHGVDPSFVKNVRQVPDCPGIAGVRGGRRGHRRRRDRRRSEEHTSELQSLMRISYAVFCLKKKK